MKLETQKQKREEMFNFNLLLMWIATSISMSLIPQGYSFNYISFYYVPRSLYPDNTIELIKL